MYVLHCLDKADSVLLREAHREAHAAYMKRHADRVVLGGPLLGADGQTRIGMLVVIDMPDRVSAERFSANEPYRRAGLFASVSLEPFHAVMACPSSHHQGAQRAG